ncbi:hypothetical protein GDO78_009437 [Eleutherodactylus coqui]|uniref:Uncharacterized protein n=1 Tax=Eleutherodactylus coqui TaxID=57060 RepID=A0A8J6K7E1_ELECQ|nr:hypothetical protein GDO78_009437 [Eleutherodactylus coqui]
MDSSGTDRRLLCTTNCWEGKKETFAFLGVEKLLVSRGGNLELFFSESSTIFRLFPLLFTPVDTDLEVILAVGFCWEDIFLFSS